MVLTASEEQLAQQIGCSVQTLMRAKVILNLIQSMDALTSAEKEQLLERLAEIGHLDSARILDIDNTALDSSVQSWGLEDAHLGTFIANIGHEDVSTRIPAILEAITGFASAIVEPETPPIELPNIELPDVPPQKTFQRVDVIFCQHDPTRGIYQYTLLLSGHQHRRTLHHTPPQTSLADFIQIPTSWGQHQIHDQLCTATPYPSKHPDEDEIVADMLRQYGPFDIVLKLEQSCLLPIPNLRERELKIPESNIHIRRHQSIDARGLSIQHNSRVELEWPESTQLETQTGQDARLLNAAITKTQRKVVDRHHSRGRTHLRISQIHGPLLEHAYVSCTGLQHTEHRLHGIGGVGASISGEAAQVYVGFCGDAQIFHHAPLDAQATWPASLEGTSGQMRINQDHLELNLSAKAVQTAHRHRPVQYRTPPMQISEQHELQSDSEVYPLPFGLQIDSVAELESKIQATDWRLANKAEQSTQALQSGDISILLHIDHSFELQIECKPHQRLEELIDGESTDFEHSSLQIQHEYKCLKQPEYVVMTMKGPDISRTWKVENRCHRHIWSVYHQQELRLRQATWMDDSDACTEAVLQQGIRVGWSDVGWWLNDDSP